MHGIFLNFWFERQLLITFKPMHSLTFMEHFTFSKVPSFHPHHHLVR